MGFFDTVKAKKAIATIMTSVSPAATDVIQAGITLKKIGEPALPLLIDALSEGVNTEVFDSLLQGLVSDKTLGYYLDALAEDDHSAVPVIKRVLATSDKYDANLMIDVLDRDDIRKEYVIDIIKQQAARINQRQLLDLLHSGSSSMGQTVFKILQSTASEDLVPSLITYSRSESPDTRYRVVRLMSAFSSEAIRTALFQLLKDPNKNVRMAALEGLSGMDIPVPTQTICKLLRDPDLMVQSKAIEVLIKLNDANTVKFLIEYLQDESEYIRRAAVEVLNEVGDTRAIKDLLMALRDQDWWVRVRSADALGSIGGPRVVDAVLALIKDEDPFLRRTAVEILNTSKDERAFDSLVNALKDEDWWVRERAADALASMGNEKAVKPLRELLDKDPQTVQVAIRALASLGDRDSVQDLIRAMTTSHPSVQKEAIAALSQLADDKNAEQVQQAMTQMITLDDSEIKALASDAAADLADRFAGRTQVISRASLDLLGERAVPNAGNEEKSSAAIKFNKKPEKDKHSVTLIDADRLREGDSIADRYQVIKRVGKGGFGTVILVHDKVVDDKYILKFLNPSFASDESVVQRFTHELRYARKVTHENIIRIYDFLTFGMSYAISMEYFESHSLADELDSGAITDMKRMVKIARDLCRGMSTAQQVNVVHRDLKPANILINDHNQVKIVDFGLAAAASNMDGRITKTGILVGTPTYMAPEQARGEDIDSRTDIYSLGVIMYRIFTGRAPYDEKDPMSTLLKHVEGKVTPPRKLNAEIPEKLEAIIRKCMAVSPSNRYQTFTALTADLELLLETMS